MNSNDLHGEALLKAWESVRTHGLSQEQHAQELGMKYTLYKTRYYGAMANRRKAKLIAETPDFKGFDRPELFDWKLPTEWIFDWDNFMVVGDVQIPTTDYNFALLPAVVAAKHLKRPRNLIIAGDFINFDAISKYEKVVKHPDLKDEYAAGANILANWYETFDEIYFLCGNHERRKLFLMKGEESPEEILAAVKPPNGRIRATVWDRSTILTSQGKYTVLHGDSYRQLSLSAANRYAQKFQSHIISQHEHHAAIGMDEFDRYFIINNGGLFDVNKMAYVQLTTTTKSGMSQAFTMVRDGYPTLFGKWTNWKEWI